MAKRPSNRASTVSDDGFVTLFDDAVVQDVRTALAAKGRKQRDVERIIHTLCDRLIDDQWALAKWHIQQDASRRMRSSPRPRTGGTRLIIATLHAPGQQRRLALIERYRTYADERMAPTIERQREKKNAAMRAIGQGFGILRQKGVLLPCEASAISDVLERAKARWGATVAHTRKVPKVPKRPRPPHNAVAVLVDAGLSPGTAAKFVVRLYGQNEWLERAIQRIKALQMLVTREIKIKEGESKIKESAGGFSKIARETLRLEKIDAMLAPPLSDREKELRIDERRSAIPLDALLALRDQLEGERKTYEAARLNVPSLTTMAYPKKA